MTVREGLLATIHGEQADRIPFQIRTGYLKDGCAAREARNKGMGINYVVSCMHRITPHVREIKSTAMTTKRKETRITNQTPVGEVSCAFYDVNPFGGGLHGIYGGPTEYRVKKLEDWNVVKYFAENTEYEPYYDRFDYFKHLVGDEGVIFTFVGYHSPYTSLLIDWAGPQRLYIDHFRHPEIVEGILEAIAKNQEKQFPIAVNSPADILKYGDHIDGKFISPPAFEKYILPLHNKFARMAHAKGKVTGIHCDGKLNSLKHLIAELEHNIIHAVTPPPVGDLPIKEALELWDNKTIWVNYEYHFMGPKALKKHLLKLLRSIIPGYRVVMDASTERWVPPDCLRMFANIMSKATLPLTKQKIRKIEKST
jgi:hypothetical protein